jgi:hypothetical protein
MLFADHPAKTERKPPDVIADTGRIVFATG